MNINLIYYKFELSSLVYFIDLFYCTRMINKRKHYISSLSIIETGQSTSGGAIISNQDEKDRDREG